MRKKNKEKNFIKISVNLSI